MIVYKSRRAGNMYEKVFFIKKWAGAAWSLQYLKCKHYLAANPFTVYYHGSKLLQAVSTYTVPFGSFAYNSYVLSTIQYFEVMQTRMSIEIDLSNALNAAIARGLNWENQVNYVMLIVTDNLMPFNGITGCQAVGGFDNLNGKTVSCTFISTNQLIISNFNKILTNYNGLYSIKVDATTNLVSTMGLSTTAATVYVYAGP